MRQIIVSVLLMLMVPVLLALGEGWHGFVEGLKIDILAIVGSLVFTFFIAWLVGGRR